MASSSWASTVQPDSDWICLQELTGRLLVEEERLKCVDRLQDQMAKQLTDSLDSVEQLEKQQLRLLSVLRTACERGQEGETSAAAALVMQIRKSQAGDPTRLGHLLCRFGHGSRMAETDAPQVLEPVTSNETSRDPVPTQGPRVTTLRVRNFPRACTQEELATLWPANCPHCPYNLLYAPHRKTRRGLHGYLFINFLSEEGAQLFREMWDGHMPEGPTLGHEWRRPLEVTDADIQGFDRNMQSFVDLDLGRLRPELWPIVVLNGERQDFVELALGFQQSVRADQGA